MSRYDIAIIGAGIAGASLAAELGASRKVLLIEAEDQPGYHSTGRSAAFWTETYGGPDIQPLTTASYDFLANPPTAFSETGFLRRRGALHLGTTSDSIAANGMKAEFAVCSVRLDALEGPEIAEHLPGRRPGWDVALWEPDCCDIDVGALHQAYLRSAKKAGMVLAARARVIGLSWADGCWGIETQNGQFQASVVVNAAGAWADQLASIAGVKPLRIQPYRRTMAQLQVTPGAPPELPLVVALDGSFYFKPDTGGRVWLSPHDETASDPCDAAPEEIDVAKAIARFEEVVDWRVERVEHAWAGLRSFAPDRLPVIGFDRHNPAFFWLAGQGGFGIQTAPTTAQVAAALLTGGASMIDGIDPARYSPYRFA